MVEGAAVKKRKDLTYRGREVHGGGNQHLARRDLEAINGTGNGRHFDGIMGIEK